MKKILGVLSTIFMIGGFFVTPQVTNALGALDQEMAVHGGGNYIGFHEYTGQSFKPTHNVLNGISVRLKGTSNADIIAMEVTKTNDPTKELLLPPTLSVHTTVDADFRWYTYTFPDVPVTVGQSYTIWLADFDGNSTSAYWDMYYGATDNYTNGKTYIDCADFISTDACDHSITTADWNFRTYGYSTLTPPVYVPPVTPPGSSPFGGTQATTKPAATVEAALAAPVLTSLKKGDTSVTVPVTETVEVTQNGKLSLAGTSVEGGEVNVTFGDRSYPASMGEGGNWTMDLAFTDVKTGDYTVKAKTLKNNKTSTEVEFFKIKVSEVTKAGTVAANKSWFAGWNIFYVIIPVAVLLLLLLLLAIIARRHHKEKTAGTTEEKKDEKVAEEKPDESVEEPKEETKKKK